MSDTRPDLAAIKARAVLAFPSRADIGDAPELVPCGGEQEIVAATGPRCRRWEVERLTAERDALRAAVSEAVRWIDSADDVPAKFAVARNGLRAALTPDAEA